MSQFLPASRITSQLEAPGLSLRPARQIASRLELVFICKALVRNWRLLVGLGLAAALAAFALSLLMTRRFKATASIQVLNQSGDLSGTRLSGASDPGSDPLDFNMTLQTQVNVLTSDTLALQVIDELGLRSNHDFRYHSRTLSTGSTDSPAALTPRERVWLVEQFHKHLAVSSLAGTRVIQIDFSNPDPAIAAEVPNRLLADFQRYNYQTRYESALGPSGALTQELQTLRKKIVDEDSAAAGLQQKAGLYGADNFSVVFTRLQAVNRLYLDAESNAVLKKAVYDATRSGDPELISALVGPGGNTSLQGGGLTLINSLRDQQAQVAAEYAQMQSRYGEDYPKLAETRTRLRSIENSIKTEVIKLSKRALSDYQIASKQEAEGKDELAKQTALANKASNNATSFTMLKDEADSDKKLYLSLSEKLDQAKLVAGLQSSNFSVIDPARKPALPNSPKRALIGAVGLAFGLALGAIISLVQDGRDKRLRNAEEAENVSGVPLLGLIPRFPHAASSQGAGLLFTSGGLEGGSISVAAAEAYRTVRTALLLSNPASSGAMICMIASATEGEGKTTTAINVAAAFAKLAGRTLLIDADLRRGSAGQRLQIRSQNGLADSLRCGFQPSMIQQVSQAEHLDMLGAGSLPSDPSELLTSDALAVLLQDLRERYDYIFLDTPPSAIFTDAAVLAKHVDSFLFVVRPGVTSTPALCNGLMRVSQTGLQCLGLLVNGIEPTSSDYADYGMVAASAPAV